MASLEELRTERLKKLELLRLSGVNPYPVAVRKDYDLDQVIEKFDKLTTRKKPITLAGRVRALRGQGGILFFDFEDGTASFQGVLKKDEMVEKDFQLFRDTVDLGDFIQISGSLFVTNREEKTLAVKEWKMLAKSLRPLPGEWSGLADVEERFRRRYLDSLMSPEVKKRFILRSKLATAIRTFLGVNGFLEVETPMLQPQAGGATAAPFVTHHQTLSLDLYLRVAPELYLKEMLVGGFPKVFEFGRSFRNEGIDATHNPEFTSLEVYTAYSTPKEQRELVTELLQTLVQEATGGTEIVYQGNQISFDEIPTVSFLDLLKKYTLLTDLDVSDEELKLKANQFGVKVEAGEGRDKILDALYKKVCRPKLVQPVFIVDYPVEFSPLAKREDGKADLIDRFQLVAGGLELVNGFAELNDPLEQAERFAEQEKRREAGDKEAQKKDAEYTEAMEYGMPPACGWGLGFDRLVMLFSDTPNIREVIFFPTLRPKE